MGRKSFVANELKLLGQVDKGNQGYSLLLWDGDIYKNKLRDFFKSLTSLKLRHEVSSVFLALPLSWTLLLLWQITSLSLLGSSRLSVNWRVRLGGI